ncbi:MAG: hypothetical protein JRF33_22850 [Deltaproteobacteria bacterium]|nr:hypothetical protein [Deltaproteobacteria bacterium]
MSLDRYLALFREYRRKSLFTPSDFETLLDAPAATVRVQLSRMVSRGVLTRIRQGLYANPFSPPSVDEVAMALRSPAYISLESALARHGVLSQSPVTITLVTTGQPYVFHAMDLVFEYHHIKREIFTGFERQGACLLAEPEKALADLIYLRHRRRKQLDTERLRSLLDDMDLDLLNRDRLAHYAQGMKLDLGVFDI